MRWRSFTAEASESKKMIELKPISQENVWKIVHLSVLKEQEDFVATNAESILQAFAVREDGYIAMPFGLYAGDTPVGFVMFGYGSLGEEEEPAIAKGNYCIWRFMIDKGQQGKGYGREGLEAALKYVRAKPLGPAEYCYLSYEPENRLAKKLYEQAGFRENGQTDGEELVSVLKL